MLCVYCGNAKATTRDHVPGRAFFPEPRPVDLITVPACARCHGAVKLDEDYFRQVATMTRAASTGAGRVVWDTKARRAIRKDNGLRNAIVSRVESVDLMTPAGIFVRQGLALRVDWPRVNRFVEKCIRGLFYFETDGRLPLTACIKLQYFEDGDHGLNVVVQHTAHGKRRWPDVFDYRRAIDGNDPHVSLWAMTFYRGMAFGASTDSVITSRSLGGAQ